jgi:hypothetical protein
MISIPGVAPGFSRLGELYVPSEEPRVQVQSRAPAYLPPHERERREREAAYPGLLGLGAAGLLGVTGGSSSTFDYLTIPSLTLALDAAVGVTAGADGDDAGSEPDVSSWTDRVAGLTFAAGGVKPNYRATDANANGQPSVVFDIANNGLQRASTSLPVAWLAAVAWYPGTTFTDYDTLFAARTPLNVEVLRGNMGMSSWLTSAPTGTRYRDGIETATALTTANAVHLYEIALETPIASTNAVWEIGRASSSRYWRGGICLLLAASAVPDAPTRAALLAYCKSRFGTP